jgi:hypothetical protein
MRIVFYLRRARASAIIVALIHFMVPFVRLSI